MHDIRLRLQHLYDKPISINCQHSNTPSSHLSNKYFSHNLKIQTKDIKLEPDYDLPLKQLQYTKTRKYKQNLNPIFEQLQTTQDRYSYSKQWEIENKYDNKGNKNDQIPVSDRYLMKQPRKEEKSRVNQLKRRSRILSQNVKKDERSSVNQYGEFGQTIENKQRTEQIEKPQQGKSFRLEQIVSLNPSTEQLTSIERSTVYIEQFLSKISSSKQSIKQSEQKLDLLTKKLQMHKQKSLIKQRQLFYLEQQKESLLTKAKELQESLKQWSEKYTESEKVHNDVSKRLRTKKKELKKEENWLNEENQEIKRIEKRIEEVLKLMRQAEEQQEKREEFLRQLEEQTVSQQELNNRLQQLQTHIQSLTHQQSLLEQQTTTLNQHLQQLLTLEQKFHNQTSSLIQTIEELNQQMVRKHEFIQQEKEIDSLIREVELEMGQISERKIFLDQEIHQVNLKISLKKRNINYINGNQQQTSELGKTIIQGERLQRGSGSTFHPNHHNYQTSFNHHNSFHNLSSKKPTVKLSKQLPSNPLPTIRQQSNTTSVYQSPNIQTQQAQLQSQQGQVESESLQLNSRLISQTQILKPHQNQSPQKEKKYFVIQSEDDNLNGKSLFYVQYNSSGVKRGLQKGESKGDNQISSEEMFVERQKKPSIQQRLYHVENSFLRTQNSLLRTQNQDHNFKSISVDLSSPNNYHLPQLQQSQQTQHFPIAHPPNNKQKPHSKQKQSQKRKKPSFFSSKLQSNSPRSISSNMEEEVLESLIQQYHHIKSNSCFQESWKHKI